MPRPLADRAARASRASRATRASRAARAAAPLAGVLLAMACASAQTSSPPPVTPAAPPGAAHDSSASGPVALADTPVWLVADDAGKTVTIALQVTRAPGGAVRINGHRDGELQIVVPLGWTVQWDWRNADSAARHSLVVMAEREKLPTEGGHPVFSNAMTRMVSAGLEVGQGDRTTFSAEEAGWYWLLCGVPGHAIAGEFLGLRIDPEAKTASVKRK